MSHESCIIDNSREMSNVNTDISHFKLIFTIDPTIPSILTAYRYIDTFACIYILKCILSTYRVN